MRSLLLIIVLLALVGGSLYLGFSGSSRSAPGAARIIAPGDTAPDFLLEDTRGQQVSLSGLRGKVVLVNFWATWCPPCRAEMPSMEQLNAAMAGEDFVMLAINVEENGRSVVPPFLARTPHSFTVLYDDQGVTRKSYGVYQFPESFVVRKDGKVDDKIIGIIDWARPTTIAYFKKLAKG